MCIQPPKNDPIHWARLAAKEDPQLVTLIIHSNKDRLHDNHPYVMKFPDTHIIAYFTPNTLQYCEPTFPFVKNKPKLDPSEVRNITITIPMAIPINWPSSLKQLLN